ncbi:hypothetical protein GUJ93_ZPchr0006g42397 [Zizania palustris]|uniref:Uncharacterized protein n=1 Tax=Zizania palustris TaxID=103762 RepID=A0A8J5SL71_ZIZPA|nr:hypothetical protein GUJ93_ZPchr0006g42397 [Zizania palustris]
MSASRPPSSSPPLRRLEAPEFSHTRTTNQPQSRSLPRRGFQPGSRPKSMASSNPGAAAAGDDDFLDELLDSALDDFTSLDLSAAPKSSGEASASSASGDGRPVKGLGLGLGLGLPDPKASRRRAAKQPSPAPPRGAYASEALEKLTRETREAVRGLETATGAMAGLDDDAMMEEFVKQFEEFAGAQDMESIVETMMQQLLSKEILYEPMKDIVEKYPKWLEDNKSKISKEEYERYQNQLELMLKLNEVYENEPGNMSKIFEIMQNMQECGQPPSDLVQEIAPDLDLSKLGQLSPEMLESAPNCCVM